MDLHALLDDVEGVHEGVGGDCCAGAAGCWGGYWLIWHVMRILSLGWLTGGERMMSRSVATHGLLHDFVRCKVNRVCRSCARYQLTIPSPPDSGDYAHTSSQYHTRQPSPQRHIPLHARNCRYRIANTSVYRRWSRVDNLHACL